MKIKISAKTLKEILSTVGPTSSRSTLPILGCVKIEASKDGTLFAANNLQASVELVVEADVVEPGSIALNYDMLKNIVAQVSDGDIVISTKDLQATIQIGKQKAKMNGFDTKDFPEFNEDDAPSFTLDAVRLLGALLKVSFSVSSDVSRPALQSVMIKQKDNGIVVAAMDGYRLAEARIDGDFDLSEQVLIPSSNLKSLIEILKVSGYATVKKSGGTLVVSCDSNGAKWTSACFVSALVDGQIPDYEKIIPAEGLCEVELSTDTLKHVVSMAKVYATENRKISFEFDGQCLYARAVHPELGEYFSGEIDCKTSGQPMTITVNVNFLSDILNAVNTNDIEVWFYPHRISAVFEKDNPRWIAGFASFFGD